MKKVKLKYPQQICADCGEQYGKRKCGVATWNEDRCDICGEVTMVTEPRDFGGLNDDWKNIDK